MKKLVLFFVLISVFVLSCKKDDPSPEDSGYNILTGTVTGITNKSATITGELKILNGNNIVTYGHVWSDSHNPTVDFKTKTTFGTANSDISFTSELTMLMQGKEYFIRAYITDSAGTYYGKEISFKTESSFFEFVVSSNYLQDDSYVQKRAWVMLYGNNNELLGIKEISNGQTYSFNPPANKAKGNYMVQLFSFNNYVSSSYSDYYMVSAYVNVAPEVWYLGREPGEPITQIGTNVVSLTDLDLNNYYNWSAQNQYSYGSYDQYSKTLTFRQYTIQDKIWISYANENQAPYYKCIENVTPNLSFTLSSFDFAQMTNYVDINLQNNTYSYVYIYSEDDLTTDYLEWFECFYKHSDNQTTVRAYYPGDFFNGYRTSISVYRDNSYESMTKYRGDIPSQFVSLPVNVSVANENIHNFSATYSGNADYTSSYWVYYDNFNTTYFRYYVYGSAEDVKSFSAPDLPYEISFLNEAILNLNNLSYSGTSFSESNYYNGYIDFIKQIYNQPNSSNVVREYYYSKTIYKEDLKNIEMFKEDLEEMQPLPVMHSKR